MVELSGEVADTVPLGASVSVRINVADNISPCAARGSRGSGGTTTRSVHLRLQRNNRKEIRSLRIVLSDSQRSLCQACPTLARLIEQSILDHVANELGGGLQMHLLKNARPIRAHGLVAQ